MLDMSYSGTTLDQDEQHVALTAMLSHISYSAKALMARIEHYVAHPSYDTRASIKERAIQIDGAWRAVYTVFQYPHFEGDVWETVQTLDAMNALVASLYKK